MCLLFPGTPRSGEVRRSMSVLSVAIMIDDSSRFLYSDPYTVHSLSQPQGRSISGQLGQALSGVSRWRLEVQRTASSLGYGRGGGERVDHGLERSS